MNRGVVSYFCRMSSTSAQRECSINHTFTAPTASPSNAGVRDMIMQASSKQAHAETETLNWGGKRNLLADVDSRDEDRAKPCHPTKNNKSNNNVGAKKRWDFVVSKVSASRSNQRSTEDDSQCTGATSKMTDSTASTNALSQKFTRAARSNILSRSKSKGGSKDGSTISNFDDGTRSDMSQDNYQTNNQVEAWMVNPQSPIDTINEHLATATGNRNIPQTGREDRIDEAKKINPQQNILREKEETIINLQTQLSYERRGFAIMATKFKEEKNNMSAQVQDLSWKFTLRGKKVSRLEKIVEKGLLDNTPKKERGEKQTSALVARETALDRNTQEVMNVEEADNGIETLNAEFDELKSSHDEMTMKYRDLSQTVRMKCTQLELEIATFKDMVENLNRFDMLHPTAYGCLFESLNQLGKVKDDLSNLVDRDATTADTEDIVFR